MVQAPQRDLLVFLRGLLHAPRSVGAVAPSSRFLVRAMLDAAHIEQARVIAEFGPGTGVFTRAIVERMRPDARLFVFEINPVFVARLRRDIRDRRATIVDVSAADSADLLRQHAALPADVVVSGLPFTSLPQPVTHAILHTTVQILRPGGAFVTYQYSTVMRRLLLQYFPGLRTARWVLRNVPPAFVFVGSPPCRS